MNTPLDTPLDFRQGQKTTAETNVMLKSLTTEITDLKKTVNEMKKEMVLMSFKTNVGLAQIYELLQTTLKTKQS